MREADTIVGLVPPAVLSPVADTFDACLSGTDNAGDGGGGGGGLTYASNATTDCVKAVKSNLFFIINIPTR